MHNTSEPAHDADAQLRAAASGRRLWSVAKGRAEAGDPQAAKIAETCARIHQATSAEAERISGLAIPTDIVVDADASGQLHLITLTSRTRESAQVVSRLLTADGYVPWQAPEGAAEEVFFRTNTQRTFVHLGDVTRTVVLNWPGSRLLTGLPEPLRPTARDWDAVTLPPRLWWGYFALRPLRLLKERAGRSNTTALPLGPILSTPIDLIDKLLDFADLGSDDHLVDLGCGDGRVLVHAVSTFDCRATGVEQDIRLVKRARNRIESAGLTPQIDVHEGDANTFDLTDATIVFLFIPAEHIGSVAQSLRTRGFAGRIISHEQQFVDGPLKPSTSEVILGESSLTVAHRW